MKPLIRLRAFAKINLGLKIVGKRPDEYHEIRTVYQTVELHDKLEIRLEGRFGIRIECNDPAIPTGRDNLVYRAGALWKRATGFRGGMHVCMEKCIPAGGGLGGASSDAAATLLGLERLTGNRLLGTRLFRLAAKLGSDVPFFLWGGRALGISRGEEVYSLPDLPPIRCLIVFPGFHVSTAEAYRAAGRGRRESALTKGDKDSSIYGFGAWSQLPLSSWGPAENDFERVIFARWPELARLKRQLIRAGAKVASLTGTGSSIFALFDSARALALARGLVPRGWKLFSTRTLSQPEYRRLVVQ